MHISDIIEPGRCCLDAPATSKKRILESMGCLLAEAAGEAVSSRAVFDTLCARERLGSTGLGFGVAIPHARVRGLDTTVGAFLRAGAAVDYDAPDGTPVDLVFGLAVPEEHTEEHLRILADLAQVFSSEELRARLRDTVSADEACRILCQCRCDPRAVSADG